MFRNPQEEQNPKLPLELNFEQDFNEKNGKMSATNEIAGTVYWKLPKTNIQNYIAIFSEEDPLYRTHNSEIGNIRFLDCDHVTAKYL